MKIRAADVILFVIFSAAAMLLIFFGGRHGQSAEIYMDNTLILKIDDIYQDKTIDVGGMTVLCSKDNGIAAVSSGCPDKICVKTGYVNKVGQTIICLPNKIIIKVVGQSDGIDGVV